MANSTAAVSDFKAHLSAYLRHVQNGNEITILDHKRPIAKVVPIERESLKDRLGIIPAKKKKFRDIRPKGIKLNIDPAQYVIEDREDRLP
ncbi:MAG: hypothetical protein OHK0011_09390 [Turneriella sp.]